ncbi:MAG: GntR family transcriptional regulator [Nocardioidaceae bacterium]
MSGLTIAVDLQSGPAPWRQIRDQVLRAILTGALQPGDRLPPIRQLARDLGLAPGTVARSYRELETRDWVTTARARGTVVTERTTQPGNVRLQAAAREFTHHARSLDADPELAVQAILAAFEQP